MFENALRVHRMLKIPAMTGRERKVYKDILKTLSQKMNGRVLNIFEYGSGLSTIYYAQFMRTQKIPFHLDAIDNNRIWYNRVAELIAVDKLESDITLHLCEFKPFWEKEGWDWNRNPEPGRFAPHSQEELNYINTPRTLNKKFDLIFVDARFRRRCLEVTSQCLTEQGIVVLHDAQRPQYHPGVNQYRYSEFLDSGRFYPFEKNIHQMWLGSHDNQFVVDLIRKYRR
jgi:hypothetical protein